MIKAEEARRIANGNSVEIQQQLTVICKQIERCLLYTSPSPRDCS